jgi:methionyl-tRNA formyltransferase
MHIVLLCATRRGQLVLQKVVELMPKADITVFSFREDPWEPQFFDQIKEITLNHGGTFIEARQVGNQENISFWETAPIDIAFAVSWRYMIPSTIYQTPILGTYVFHDSYLPAYRGFSPTVWAMINGENHTGATLFEISDEVDAGDIIDQEIVPIGPDETISVVVDRVTQIYLGILERNLTGLLEVSITSKPQDHNQATYTCKRTLEDNQINWTAPTEEVYNLIRALSHPYPGAYTFLLGKKIQVWSAKRLQLPKYDGRIPGRVIQILPGIGSVVLTGDGALLIKEVQSSDGQVECAANVINSLSQTLGR